MTYSNDLSKFNVLLVFTVLPDRTQSLKFYNWNVSVMFTLFLTEAPKNIPSYESDKLKKFEAEKGNHRKIESKEFHPVHFRLI